MCYSRRAFLSPTPSSLSHFSPFRSLWNAVSSVQGVTDVPRALGLGFTVQRVYSTSSYRATPSIVHDESSRSPTVKLEHLLKMPSSVFVCIVGVNERVERRRFASESGRVFLTWPCYFWICILLVSLKEHFLCLWGLQEWCRLKPVCVWAEPGFQGLFKDSIKWEHSAVVGVCVRVSSSLRYSNPRFQRSLCKSCTCLTSSSSKIVPGLWSESMWMQLNDPRYTHPSAEPGLDFTMTHSDEEELQITLSCVITSPSSFFKMRFCRVSATSCLPWSWLHLFRNSC